MASNPMVSALDARSNFAKYLRRVENDGCSLVIHQRGIPRAVLISIRAYLRLATPEPEVLRLLGEESKCKGTNKLTPKQIEHFIRKARIRRRPPR